MLMVLVQWLLKEDQEVGGRAGRVALARNAASVAPAAIAALSLTLDAIARGTRLSMGRRSWDVVGVERQRGSHGRVGVKHDLL
jgi:hypothetical protein